ncbi:Chaperone protein dnaJ 2 [Diplonema papillatum]|nr:Chaperone protein dnaJ 2 [Diplonema papillatum]
MNPQDIFGMMGGMHGMGGGGISDLFGGGGMRGPRVRKGRDVALRLPVSLETLYKGEMKEVELPKTILCPDCDGTGNRTKKKSTCDDCHGNGVKLVRRAIGPGMVQQMQVPCDGCQGQGNKIKDSDRCIACSGQRTKEVSRTLKVDIKPGMEHQTQIPFEGEGDQDPSIDIPGSIVVVLMQEKDDRFEREEDDLKIEQTIALQEALLGCAFVLEHLDGRKLYVHTPAGQVIVPGQMMTIKGEGMPREGGGRGNLHILFNIDFPRTMGDDQIEKLKSVLPGGRKTDKDYPSGEEPEECFMDDYDPEDWQKMAKIGEDEEDDMDDEGGPQQGVRCAHQ